MSNYLPSNTDSQCCCLFADVDQFKSLLVTNNKLIKSSLVVSDKLLSYMSDTDYFSDNIPDIESQTTPQAKLTNASYSV